VLLAAVLIASALEWLVGRRGRALGSAVLGLAGLGLVLPALLILCPATHDWARAFFGKEWLVPDKALGPVLAGLGGLGLAWAAASLLRARSDQRDEVKSRPGGWSRWISGAAGAGLVLIGLLLWDAEWRQSAWNAYIDDRLQLPGRSGWMSADFAAWRDVQLWAAQNTPPDAVFATDPDEKGFRVFSRRAPVVEEKDGAPTMFSRSYAVEWGNRMQAMAQAGVLDTEKDDESMVFSGEGLAALHAVYPFAYVVGRLPQDLGQPIYTNELYGVYAWPGE
jgi:hypothetical protein